MTTALPVPDASYSALFAWHEDRTSVSTGSTLRRIATPVVVAELLALAGNVLNLPVPDGVDPDGFDAARWAFREMIADRCDELGTRVEEL